jgi:O-antigen/teichoic acid export membrane protein
MIKKVISRFDTDFRDKNFIDIIKGGAATFLIRLIGLVAGYAFTVIISRYFGAGVLGAHTISVTVLMMFTIIGRLGMDTFLVKHLANDHAEERWDRIFEVYRKTLLVIVPFGLILSVILFYSSESIADFIFHKKSLTPYFQVISFGVLPMVLRFVNSECYRGFRMNKEYAYTQNVSYFLYATVILGIFTLFSKKEWMPNIAFVASLIVLAISSTFVIYRKIKNKTNAASNDFSVSEMVKQSLPMLMANSMLLISGWINTLMLGIWSTSADVGIYSVVLKIATFSTFVLMSINSIATPRFAQFYAKQNMEGFKKYVNQTAKIIFYSSIPIFIVIIAFNKWILGLFGEEFIIGSAALLITMCGQLFNVFAGSVGAILIMTGHQVIFRNIILVSTFLNVVLCVILIPNYGLIGSAISGMAYMASWNLLSMIYIKRKLSISSFYNPLI